jgi:hypothetical protein
VWRDCPQPLALAGVAAELVDIFDGQRACKRRLHAGKARGGQLVGRGRHDAQVALVTLPPDISGSEIALDT